MTHNPPDPDNHMPYYHRGRAWLQHILDADRTNEGTETSDHLAEADLLLSPLGSIQDPQLLLDFIAGAARQAEHTRTPHR